MFLSWQLWNAKKRGTFVQDRFKPLFTLCPLHHFATASCMSICTILEGHRNTFFPNRAKGGRGYLLNNNIIYDAYIIRVVSRMYSGFQG